MKNRKTGILMGGLSKEREVSLSSGKAVADALKTAGYNIVQIDVTSNLDRQIREADIDVAFIALHGRFGEDGTVQGLLEIMGIPYTGSSLLASAIAIDKNRTRQILQLEGIKTAPGFIAENQNDTNIRNLNFPLVVKPAIEGSSVGVSIAKNKDEYIKALKTAFECSDNVLIEQFVPGKEIQVAIIDSVPIGAVEVEPHGEFYDYDSKYKTGGSTHHIPPRIPELHLKKALAAGKKVFDAIGCSGAARVDLIMDDTSDPTVLEINTIPGMTPTSLLPEIAAHAGIPFNKLVSQIIDNAKLHIK